MKAKKGDEFRMSLKIKDCNIEFTEGMGKGIIATRVFVMSEDCSSLRFARGIIDYEDDMIEETMTVITEKI